MTKFYVYTCGPIDRLAWLRELEEHERAAFDVFAALANPEKEKLRGQDDKFAFDLPHPDSCGCMTAFVLKLDNNGTTFIGSFVPLPYLKNDWNDNEQVFDIAGLRFVERDEDISLP